LRIATTSVIFEKHQFPLFWLSEFPLAVGVTHRYTLCFFYMLVRDGGEEAVKEASGEET
jgi:hypothetical protein